jgi:aminoglycoside/choline kinase family phosphotransferase
MFRELTQVIVNTPFDAPISEGVLDQSKEIDSIKRLPGDASTRRYYRVTTSHFGSYILMRMEPFLPQSNHLPFLAVQNYLEQHGVPVPRVLAVDAQHGFILLEDLGDCTFLKVLQGVRTDALERGWYKKAIVLLVQLQLTQIHSVDPRRGKQTFLKLAFDQEKLMWEVNFAIDHFYIKYLARTISVKHQKLMNAQFAAICSELSSQPRVLTHRDLHSRNIMVQHQKLILIDFQDARLGPQQYDLVSLLKDSYYQLSDAQVNFLIDVYLEKYEKATGQKIERRLFQRIFDLMTIQRNFKAIGSFASFWNQRGDPMYLKFIGNTFENIRKAFLKYPEFSDLREILFQYYYF